MKAITNKMDFEGLCPFITCIEHRAHSHTICPECHAVRYGNMHCEHCRTMRRLLLDMGMEP